VVTSPTDLTTWAACEWAFLRRLDAKLGRIDAVVDEADAMLERTARLGDDHEVRFLEQLRATHDVVEFERPSRDEYPAAAAAAADAMRAGADVLYQATFFDGSFIGFSDFLVRNDAGEYEVYDTKLARHAKIPALLQLAAYAEQIEALGIPVGSQVHLVLGDGSRSTHDLADISPVFRAQQAQLRAVVAERVRATSPLGWGAPGITACGRCSQCSAQVELHRDLVLVAGLTLSQRSRLNDAGVHSIDELAVSTGSVPGVGGAALARLRGQAQLQLASEHGRPEVRLVDAGALAAIPAPDLGDVFFDFEGDPLYTEGDSSIWGLDYLFGLVDQEARFTAFWAHDFREERRALVEFLAFVRERRAAHPGMHIYHYASYERTHLLALAARHGVGEEEVDDLLRDGVLVDLYPIVRKALLVGSRSYSIKKLEPLYMGPDLRDDAGVVNAADSITAYVEAITALRAGDPSGQARLDQVADYNEYDCRSTLRLRDWLLGFASTADVGASDDLLPLVDDERVKAEPDPVFVELTALVADVDPLDRDDDQQALALAAAAIDYHRREAKTFWQEHFDRLRGPVDEWGDTRDVFVVERAEVVRDWEKLPRARTLSRDLRLVGSLGPGSRLTAGGPSPHLVYDAPLPPTVRAAGPGLRGASARAVVLDVDADGDSVVLLVKESLASGGEPHHQFPLALTPAAPPRAAPQPEAISEWGRALLDELPEMRPDPALDLLRRVPPRGGVVPVVDDDTVAAVTRTLLGLDHSYLAVQGPPGTGKTYVGSTVVARLVTEHGWRVGVVGQSHAVVENFLAAVVAKGVDPSRVVKVPKKGTDAEVLEAAAWTPVKDGAAVAGFLGGAGETGGVVGGTAWTFANGDTIPRRSLDLLVVDEAGQFSLAPTIASSVAAQRLLLLGDPQQLPQVSQGSHPEPVDESALGWVADGHDVLPAELGYFLSRTYRMHPAVTAPVSRLSYAGQLESRAPSRLLEGVEPGLHVAPVVHSGDTTSSVDEAERVVELVRSVVGRRWTDEHGTRSLTDDDVIVVAPYNAQGAVIRELLDRAGCSGTTVGTVDLFQGREAVVAIVSLAASSAADIPRGLDFLLMPNRLNVAISRAKWAAWLVHSPALASSMPTSIAGLGLLSRFIELVEGGRPGGPDAGAAAGAGAS
jgi:predicted RecB family nuclease